MNLVFYERVGWEECIIRGEKNEKWLIRGKVWEGEWSCLWVWECWDWWGWKDVWIGDGFDWDELKSGVIGIIKYGIEVKIWLVREWDLKGMS